MSQTFSNDELIAAYLLHQAFSGKELEDALAKCGASEEIKKLSKEELKKLLEEIYKPTF